MTAYTYESQGKNVLCFTPAIDTRHGLGVIGSRLGISRQAVPLYDDTNIYEIFLHHNINPLQRISGVLVDEVQFLRKSHVEQLARIADEMEIPVICYGLKNDFKNELFEGSYWLLSLADQWEEVKTTCSYCGRKGTMVLRFVNGEPVYDGEQVQIGDSEYKPVCRVCYESPPKHLYKNRQSK
jgi:thymidine kinase